LLGIVISGHLVEPSQMLTGFLAANAQEDLLRNLVSKHLDVCNHVKVGVVSSLFKS
jgi:hypothetical protein